MAPRNDERDASANFIILGSFALVSVALWIGFRDVLSAAAAMLADEARSNHNGARNTK